jgi:CheY-like chemotaxis protein
MNNKDLIPKRVFLADDDEDDQLLFDDVLKEFSSAIELTVARDGEHLMTMLRNLTQLPDILFLDLNMPLKNGFECLEEIKSDKRFQDLPIIIFSTSSQPSAIEHVYQHGANRYVRKPNDFTSLKKVIHQILSVNWQNNLLQPSKEQFILTV